MFWKNIKRSKLIAVKTVFFFITSFFIVNNYFFYDGVKIVKGSYQLVKEGIKKPDVELHRVYCFRVRIVLEKTNSRKKSFWFIT